MTDVTEIDLATLGAIVEHKHQEYKKIRSLFKYFKGAQDKDSIYFSYDQLQKHGIQASSMDLERGGRFFNPVPLSEFKSWVFDEGNVCELEWDPDHWRNRDAEQIYNRCWALITSEIPKHAQTEEMGLFLDYTPWRKVIIARTHMGGNSGNYFPDELTDWMNHTALDTYESRDTDSHVISFSSHGLWPSKNTESKLARSEILVALDIIMHRMQWPPHITNHIFPVLMISCFNRQARINEVYFEDDILHFNSTPFLDMEVFDKYQ
ncbi:hypothetical protein FQN49_007738, partial [Arthroderma sp. PD_2]